MQVTTIDGVRISFQGEQDESDLQYADSLMLWREEAERVLEEHSVPPRDFYADQGRVCMQYSLAFILLWLGY